MMRPRPAQEESSAAILFMVVFMTRIRRILSVVVFMMRIRRILFMVFMTSTRRTVYGCLYDEDQ